MGEGIVVSEIIDTEYYEVEGDILMSEDKKLSDCQGSPFIQFAYWEYGHRKYGRWSLWQRIKIAYRIFKDKSPWADMVMMESKRAKEFANHILSLVDPE